MATINQFSFAVTGVAVLGVVWFVLRRRGRLLRRVSLLATAVLLALVFVALRPGSGDVRSPQDVDRALASGQPVLLEFYSNY